MTPLEFTLSYLLLGSISYCVTMYAWYHVGIKQDKLRRRYDLRGWVIGYSLTLLIWPITTPFLLWRARVEMLQALEDLTQ